jgi:hypothetical protein
LESPALAEIDVWWEDEAAESYPSRTPDLYVGEPLVLTALLPNGPGGVELTGYRGSSSWETSLSVCRKTGEVAGRPYCSPPFVTDCRLSRFSRARARARNRNRQSRPRLSQDFENDCEHEHRFAEHAREKIDRLVSEDDPIDGLSEGAEVCSPCIASNPSGDLLSDLDLPAPHSLGIAKLWARRKIDTITDSLVEGADPQTVRDAVVVLGLEHHLVTQYTSLVAVDVTPTSPVGGGDTRNVPANAPHGSIVTLPRTATPAALYGLISLLLCAAALILRPREAMRTEP